jgi:hypothetical protein
MSRRCIVLLIGILLAGFMPPAADAAETWGPFRGRLVDVETGEPIAGAAVLVVWYEMIPSPVQTNQRFYDAREAVTDADGGFEIPRRSPPFFTFRVRLAGVTYFAPGYVAHSEVVTPPGGQRFVDPTVVRMRRLKTREELREKSRSRPSLVPDEKMPGFLKAIEREDTMIYLRPSAPSPAGRP